MHQAPKTKWPYLNNDSSRHAPSIRSGLHSTRMPGKAHKRVARQTEGKVKRVDPPNVVDDHSGAVIRGHKLDATNSQGASMLGVSAASRWWLKTETRRSR
jgi:hypothetical protein